MSTILYYKLAKNASQARLIVLLFFLLSQSATYAYPTSDNTDVSGPIASLIASRQNPLLKRPDFSDQFDPLSRLYMMNSNRLLWLGKPDSENNIHTAISLLINADRDGLNPEDYDAPTLQQHIRLASSLSENAFDELAKLDTALSISLLRLVNDLHQGRVSPQQLDYPREFGNKETLDTATLIKTAIEQQALSQLPDLAAPKLKQYQRLKQALATYRQAPKELNFQPLVFEKSLRPGDHHPQIQQLRARLIATGALSPSAIPFESDTDDVYAEQLQEGVKAFQRQNGLTPDGIIGKETATLLNQTTEQKIHRIELAMERLRWLPNSISGPMILVNIPAFQLWAFKAIDDPDMLTMKVIVGKARRNQTPMLYEEMKYLEFMPYWNIPRSIMNKEILPKLYDDIGYLQNEDIELVQLYSDQEGSWDTLFDDIRQGRVRARQRPGNKNPLGKVKFVFPNKEDVYLHDTSSPKLFSRSQRDLSHGCVRVADAGKLAEFVLGIQPEPHWDETRIQEAMSGDKTRRVNLKKPIPVLFFYTTSYVDQNDQVHFYRDIYGQDKILEQALERKESTAPSNSLLTANASTPG
ncbi:MAG: L,D-transpeptidase family protein [Gammaproteobacteria bacterium]